MSFKAFHADFVTFLTNGWSATSIVETENLPNSTNSGNPFISYKTDFVGTETNSVSGAGSTGKHCIVEDVIMTVLIYVPSSTGVALAIDYGQQIMDLFKDTNISESSATRDMELIFNEESEGMFFQTAVSIHFENRNYA